MSLIVNGRAFEELAPEDQSRYIFSRPLSEQAELITLARNPAKIVGSLSPSELLFVTRETDREHLLELARYADVSQLVFLTDANCWRGDAVDHKEFVQWLSDLLEIGLDTFASVLRSLDYEMLVSSFKRCLDVVKTEHEVRIDEIVGDAPYFTLDNLYYIMVKEESHFQTIRLAVEVIYDRQKELYFELIEGILSELDSEIEEDAFSLREERLAEKGFPPADEAFRIYRRLTADEFASGEEKDISVSAAQVPGQPSSGVNLPVSASGLRRLLVDEALGLLASDPPEIQEHVARELVWIVNKVIVCRGFKLGAELLRQAADHTRAYLSLGLDVLSGGSAAKMAELLRTRWLEDIFRVGFSRAAASREKLLSCLRSRWKGDVRALADFIGAPYGRSLELFSRKQPQIVDVSGGGAQGFRDLDSLHDVGVLEEFTRLIGLVLDMLSRRGFSSPAAFLKSCSPVNLAPEDFTLGAAVGTALCRLVLGREVSFAPVSLRDFKAFLKSCRAPRTGIRVADSVRERLLGELFGFVDDPALQPTAALALNVMVDLIEKEFESYAEEIEIDPRFITLVLLESRG